MGTWLLRRRALLDQLKKQVKLHVGHEDKELAAYRSKFMDEHKGSWQACPPSQMIGTLRSSPLILGADFHAFPQSQRTHLRILRQLVTLGSRTLRSGTLVLALECFESCHQPLIDNYLSHKVDDETFLEQIQWEAHWGFPWSHYKGLMDFAKEHSLSVLGINEVFSHDNDMGGILEKRDEIMAQHLVSYGMSHVLEGGTIYGIVGEYHLAREHLPQRIHKLTGHWPIVVHQNLEQLYFQLAEQSPESRPEVMRSGGDDSKGERSEQRFGERFCVMASPPWVKWQSYLIYLERTHDKHLDLDGEDLIEGIDYTDSVQSLIEFLARDLSIEIDTSDLSVYCPADQDYLEELLPTKMTSEELDLAHWLMSNDRSFYLPSEGLVYLSRGTINHAAAMAGQYIHGKLSGRKSLCWSFPENFLSAIWVEGVSYFMSKLINYRRKTESVQDIQALLAASHVDDKGREALQLSLDQRVRELLASQDQDLQKAGFKPQRKASYLEASRILGQMLGDRLYNKYRQKQLPLLELYEILGYDVVGSDFMKTYFMLQAKLKLKDNEYETNNKSNHKEGIV